MKDDKRALEAGQPDGERAISTTDGATGDIFRFLFTARLGHAFIENEWIESEPEQSE